MSGHSMLTIAHNLFLNREERYVMRTPKTAIDTVGICLPVWLAGTATSEPAEEVFCKYRLCNFVSPGAEAVSLDSGGFTLSLGDEALWRSLGDMKDGGCGSIYLSHQGKVANNGVEVPVIHYINIQDIGVLTKGKSGGGIC